MAVAAPTTADLRAEDTLSLGGVSARKALLLVGAAALMLGSLVLIAPTFADLACHVGAAPQRRAGAGWRSRSCSPSSPSPAT